MLGEPTAAVNEWKGDLCQFVFSNRRRHTRCLSDWSSDVCSSDLVGLAGCLAPTDVGIPRRHFPGGAGEQQAGQHRAGRLRGTHEITELCPDGHLVTEIVVALKVVSKQTAVIAVVEQLQLDGKVIVDRARARTLLFAESVPDRRTR